MKAVLISIQPKWCELIAQGKKTVEVRKSKPKLEPPFKVYIYCTKAKEDKYALFLNDWDNMRSTRLDGKVMGEFVCDEIEDCIEIPIEPTCITTDEWLKYTDGHKGAVWGWHISDLVIYDTPKELGEFKREKTSGVWSTKERLKRPPQSWCYVEEMEVEA